MTQSNANQTDETRAQYTDLEKFAARLSGELCLDVTAVNDAGYAKLHATPACLRDNQDRLEEQGYNTELYLEGDLGGAVDTPTLLIYPRPGDLENDGLEPAMYAAVASVEYEAASGGGSSEHGLDAGEARDLASVLTNGLREVDVRTENVERVVKSLSRSLNNASSADQNDD